MANRVPKKTILLAVASRNLMWALWRARVTLPARECRQCAACGVERCGRGRDRGLWRLRIVMMWGTDDSPGALIRKGIRQALVEVRVVGTHDQVTVRQCSEVHMSMPVIPGYTNPDPPGRLADLWPEPAGVPSGLWPEAELQQADRTPVGWLAVVEHYFSDAKHGGIGCVLVPEDADVISLLEDTSWLGRDLGTVGIWNGEHFADGLKGEDRSTVVEFFAQARSAVGARLPAIEVSLPFLWYFDAFAVQGGWNYLNRSGRDQELIRYVVTADSWRIEVRALEFRQFLAACHRKAVIQLDVVPKLAGAPFERVDSTFENDWAALDFCALHQPSMDDRPVFSRLVGQYVIDGCRNDRAPRFEERKLDREYPTFIYGVDHQSGTPLTHTCDPDELGTYFDKDNSRLHYLTPIYFKREVLQPYAAEPLRYGLSTSRLSCLNLWGVAISINSAGLVEVYLGDLGRDLPSDDWGHWRTYNVPPDGHMDEGRFRRDFLNQWASSVDVVGDLRRARDRAAQTSASVLGMPIWKSLDEETQAAFQSLIGPLNEDASSLGQPLLLLTKVLVDAIDPKPLKTALPGPPEPGERSLQLLRRYLDQQGDDRDVTRILRELQAFRSSGGVAHLAGSSKSKAAANLEIEGLGILQAFESVATRCTASLLATVAILESASPGNNLPERSYDGDPVS